MSFFEFMRERYTIHLKRARGEKYPWTSDEFLQFYSFTNIHREMDRTTVWFRENIRDRTPVDQVLLATVVFRWFNRIVTGQTLFQQTYMTSMVGQNSNMTPWEFLMENWDDVSGRMRAMEVFETSIRNRQGSGPYVTGAYIIKTKPGIDKLGGVLESLEEFVRVERKLNRLDRDGYLLVSNVNWYNATQRILEEPPEKRSLQRVWAYLKQFDHIGDFMAYEIVCDLRYTPLLDKAQDIKTWANPGPGAMRGLNRIHGRPLNSKVSKQKANDEMVDLLHVALDDEWPSDWTTLEMREIEHSLCEYDKYLRVYYGEGRPRGRFKYEPSRNYPGGMHDKSV
jgi:hypothetical protein